MPSQQSGSGSGGQSYSTTSSGTNSQVTLIDLVSSFPPLRQTIGTAKPSIHSIAKSAYRETITARATTALEPQTATRTTIRTRTVATTTQIPMGARTIIMGREEQATIQLGLRSEVVVA